MKNNYLWLDTETTGTNPNENAIIEIGAVVNGEEFHSLVCPHPLAKVEAEAMAVNGFSMADLKNAPDFKTVTDNFIKFLDKFVDKYDKKDKLILAGYNVGFDDRFLRAMFERAGNKFLGAYKWPTVYDVQVPAIEYLQNERGGMENFKLITVAKQLGIDLEGRKLHTALDDIKLTIEIDEILCLK